MLKYITDYIYTREITLNRYCCMGIVEYKISYIKDKTQYKLLTIKSEINEYVKINLSFINRISECKYVNKDEMIKTAIVIGDTNMKSKLLHTYGFSIEFYDTTTELCKAREVI